MSNFKVAKFRQTVIEERLDELTNGIPKIIDGYGLLVAISESQDEYKNMMAVAVCEKLYGAITECQKALSILGRDTRGWVNEYKGQASEDLEDILRERIRLLREGGEVHEYNGGTDKSDEEI